jgi:hypothetical protein
MDGHMSGKNTRQRRTVIGDELLKFLKVELLLSTRSTHFLYSSLLVHNLSESALRRKQGIPTKKGIYGYRKVSGIPSASLLTSATCMCVKRKLGGSK